ncbi:MAG TPA: D-alanyl-D-alanine carboxypeptidase/D-alanyl-D-alanine-endopeptidase [Coxiellaceae bacterium]|nr:D-alanyl-D-alanine carboxypeptidase/D-alanyl-D-alanine-endopeptidase [Coxiellaceae bacterium]
MFRTLRFTLGALGALLTLEAQASSLPSQINDLLEKQPYPIHVGIVVQSASSGKILYEKNSDQLFMPASVQKLLTAVSALSFLGPEYRYETLALADGPIKEGVLNGNLVVKFSGDPLLSTHDLRDLIKQTGLKKITGQVYIDNYDYGSIPYGAGWGWEDLSYAYAAPMNAIIIDNNSFVMDIIPGELHKPAKLQPRLPPDVIKVNNYLITTTGKETCPITIYSSQHNEYDINGCLEKRLGVQHRELAIREPAIYARYTLMHVLRENGTQVNGDVVIHSVPPQATVIATHFSPPLRLLVKKMLKKSDNMIADSLLERLGAQYFKSRGTWINGSKAVKSILTHATGIDFSHNLIVDGAGLSRYNLLTPLQLSKVLDYGYKNQHITNELFEALPIAGKDGTLAYRMKNLLHHTDVRGKTGTMTGISALSGYIRTRDDTLIYVIMMNDYVGKPKRYKHLQDEICKLLVEYGY